MKYPKPFLLLLLTLFAAFVVVFNCLPRSKVSELERRELAIFPPFTPESYWSGDYTTSIAKWYSDTEPYRDEFMSMSMVVKDKWRLSQGESEVRIVAAEPTEDDKKEEETVAIASPPETDQEMIKREEPVLEEVFKIAHKGIIVVGEGTNVRALMAFGGGRKAATPFAEVANAYQQAFADSVQVYCLVIPTAAEFYTPEKVKGHTKPQRPVIDYVDSLLLPQVKLVDAHLILSHHTAEPIYLRTDHHWAPLGAYYTARIFAATAGVPLPRLANFERRVVRNFVGTMYGYSRDIAVKKAPEDFVYYVPRDTLYETTYIDYHVNKQQKVMGESKPYKGEFFVQYKDGSGAAYCTFMGGDMRLTQVRTSMKNGRRLIILKDSFGNALPGYLFQSFEEVHVLDVRYFNRNIKSYVQENGITDILFANNIFNACSSNLCKRYLSFLSA